MALPNDPGLADLQYLFYGGGSDAEYAFLQEAAAAGVSAADILDVASGNGATIAVARPISGQYLMPQGSGANSFTMVLANENGYFFPIVVPNAMTIDRIGLNVTGAGSGAAPVIRLGIRNEDGTMRPGTLLIDGGTINAASVTNQTVTISQALTTGIYWVEVAAQGCNTGAPSCSCLRGSLPGVAQIGLPSTNGPGAFVAAGVTGAFAAGAPVVTSTDASTPNAYLRLA